MTMRSHLGLVVLSTLLTTSLCWVLMTNVEEIRSGEEQHLQMECKQEINDSKITSLFSKIKMINRIRITKVNTFGIKSSVAAISSRNRVRSFLPEDKLNITGSISQDKMAYLRVTWANVSRDDEGAYGCQIDGYDKSQEIVTLETYPKIIKEKTLTKDEVEDLIQSVSNACEIKQDNLMKEIESLKTSMLKITEENKRLIKSNKLKHNVDITRLNIDMNSSYATKIELVNQGSDLKTFTTDELRTHAIRNEKSRTKLYSIVQQMNQTCQNNYTEVAQNILKLQGSMNARINKVDTDGKNSIQQVNNNFKTLTTRVTSFNTNCDLGMRNIKEELSKKISDFKCTCPTPKPIVDTSGWPGGNAAMIEAMSGCPGPMVGKTVFKSVPYYTNTFVVKNRNVNLERGVKLYLHIGSMDTEVNFCLKEGAPSTQSWPKGTYCLNIIQGACPRGFVSGYKNYHYKSSNGKSDLGMFMFKYCCRSDASASAPMKLPTNHSFYLLRHKGTCQKVAGMSVTQHSMVIETRSKDIRTRFFTVRYTTESNTPDTNRGRDTYYVCYYT